MTIQDLFEQISKHDDCEIFLSEGLPQIESIYQLPKDLHDFYKLCGGVVLYKSTNYPVRIVPPKFFVPANPVMLGGRYEEDISSNWYIIADDLSGEYLTIDLESERFGYCYDSFHDRHGVVGESQIIALSFTELLCNLVEGKGDYWYWLQGGAYLGDAYD
ncbi:hypothetical protein J2Z48_003045 [Croceifilum oryzae]|uniref:Knr4/Smi1-like domain-containing protein n=1 Tax=Croceifilum oryzae TaxID=1553429 RepID=A0AAJ1WTI1_9BACL|nr:SMI1/KNR4 family protein [Croceifilum oryzae]MDQ0418840.1 hypothetical protein [Croceifilum oryzae]